MQTLKMLLTLCVFFVPIWAQNPAPSQQSPPPAQMCKDSWAQGDEYWHNPKKVEFTEALPSGFGKKVKLNEPSVAAMYTTTATPQAFEGYFNGELRRWLYAKEQDRANNKCGYASFPVGMARLGNLVIVISSQNDPAVGWPDAPHLTKMFNPIDTKTMNVFSGEWNSTGQYRSLSSWTDSTADKYSTGGKYSVAIKVGSGCSILFYQIAGDGADRLLESKAREWSRDVTNPTGCPISAARIDNTLVVALPDASVAKVDDDIKQLPPGFVTYTRFAYPTPKDPSAK